MQVSVTKHTQNTLLGLMHIILSDRKSAYEKMGKKKVSRKTQGNVGLVQRKLESYLILR